MSKPTPPRLGRGLSALIGSRTPATPASPPAAHPSQPSSTPPAQPSVSDELGHRSRIDSIPIDAIRANRFQPRSSFRADALDELAASIRETGVLQPVIVRRTGTGEFELIAGERRWRAAKLAGLVEVPAIVRDATDAESLELALVENLQREDLGPLDRAASYQQYLDAFSATPEQLAKRLGESRANVVNYLRLLRLADGVKQMVAAGELHMGHARAIVGVPEPERQLAIARAVVRRGLSVRQVEALAQRQDGLDVTSGVGAGGSAPASLHLEEVARSFSKALGVPVSLRTGRSKNSGRITIRFKSLEEFDRIAARIVGRAVVE